MAKKQSETEYSDQETAERREAALKRMLSTPHKPQKPPGQGKRRSGRSKEAERPATGQRKNKGKP